MKERGGHTSKGQSGASCCPGDSIMMTMSQSDSGIRTGDGIRLFEYCHRLRREISEAKRLPPSTHPDGNVDQESLMEDIELQSNFLFTGPDGADVQRIGTLVHSIRIKQEKID